MAVPGKLYLYKQAGGWIWLMGRGLLTPGLYEEINFVVSSSLPSDK